MILNNSFKKFKKIKICIYFNKRDENFMNFLNDKIFEKFSYLLYFCQIIVKFSKSEEDKIKEKLEK